MSAETATGTGIVVIVLAGSGQFASVVPFCEFGRNSAGALSLTQDLPKVLHKFCYLALGHDKGWQQTHYAFVGAVADQSLAQRTFHIRFAFDREFNAYDESFASH